MAHVIVVSILLVIWLLFPRRKRVPGGPKRTSKLTIIFRMAIIPLLVTAFWGLMLSIADMSLGSLPGSRRFGQHLFSASDFSGHSRTSSRSFFALGSTNFGRPVGAIRFFDTLDSPLNNDPPSVRYQELYQEKARQEWEANFGPLPTPSPPQATDWTITLDDPNII